MKLYDVIRKEELNDPKWKKAPPPPPDHLYQDHERKLPLKKRLMIYGGAMLFLVIVFIGGNMLVSAKITITEKRIPLNLNKLEVDLIHQTDASDGRPSFQSMVVSTSITREVYGSGLTQSNTKATGTIVIFNEYSTSKQTIKKGTTVTSSAGKKYTTQEAAVVSGYTIKDKKKVPGTSSPVKIQATQTGSSYNTTGTSFTVSGWNSKSIYARSAGSISGGEAGIKHVLTENEKKEAVATLQAQLIERLKRITRAQMPAELITFPDLQAPVIDMNSLVMQGSGVRFPAELSGSMISYLVSREALEQAIASKAITDQNYSKVSIPDLGALNIDILSPVPTDVKKIPDSITIRVSGQATAITKVPMEKLKETLVGNRRKTFKEKLNEFPEIDGVKVKMYPFWSPYFPRVEKKINIVTK